MFARLALLSQIGMKIALVHDYLVQYGGAERVLEAFAEIWPEAPVYTLIYDGRRLRRLAGRDFLKGRQIRTSFLQKFPFSKSRHRMFSLLMPLAVEQFDFSGFDVVLSDSASFAKGVITKPDTLHICYCHTPLRYAWDDCHRYLEEYGWPGPVKFVAPALISYLRLWDRAAAGRPDKFIANSLFVRRRIKKYYNQEAEVIHPPAETDKFEPNLKTVTGDGGYYLMAGRFLPYKKFNIAIEAFNNLGYPLKIIGSGPDEKRLRKMARSNIEFLGWMPPTGPDLRDYYQNAKAFIFPQEEDFGLVPVEAMAAGRPVIAYRGGGALETVRNRETGLFFEEQTPASLARAVLEFEEMSFDRRKIVAWARRFDKEIFKRKIGEFVVKSYREWRKNHGYRR
jgi:glycosyltransferase involved in cell wall biosynthesis